VVISDPGRVRVIDRDVDERVALRDTASMHGPASCAWFSPPENIRSGTRAQRCRWRRADPAVVLARQWRL